MGYDMEEASSDILLRRVRKEGISLPSRAQKKSYLKEIQPTVTKYAEVIANVLQVDVEIVDEKMEKISGTGKFKDDVNRNSKGLVYDSVLKDGEHKVIQFPRENEICRLCDAKGQCIETMEIATPIRFEGENIGVIGLVCTTEDQKRYINKNLASHVDFLEQISELISSKVMENRSYETSLTNMSMLQGILDNIENGVIVIDDKDRVAYMNEKAKGKLQAGEELQGKVVSMVMRASGIGNSDEYSVEIDEKSYRLMGSLVELAPLYKGYRRLFIFSTLKEVRSSAYAITSGTRLLPVENILGESPGMKEIKRTIGIVAKTDSTVLITGESGTGKELIARAIHAESDRSSQPFVGINCAAIPETLIESEFFGYAKGAFSGASPGGRIGKFELANKGVLFLDEIGDMPLYLQSKVLRVLQERSFSRVGSNEVIDIDIRVVAATNRNMEEMIRQNQFRRDLFYRLNVIPIRVPPLRDRGDDLVILAEAFLEKYNGLFDRDIQEISREAYRAMKKYPWPGNVRELENIIQYLVTLADSSKTIKKFMLPDSILYEQMEKVPGPDSHSVKSLKEVEEEHIQKVIEMYGATTEGKKKAAKVLGIGIATLYRRLGEIYQNDKTL
jgi:transcriptional regulator with PAS, ATPase and Fis domain